MARKCLLAETILLNRTYRFYRLTLTKILIPSVTLAAIIECTVSLSTAVALSLPTPEIEITSHRDGEPVPIAIDIEGRSKNLQPDQEIWIVVVPPTALYYPQDGPAIRLRGDRWRAPTSYVGVADDADKKFNVLAVVAMSKDAQDIFRDYVNGCIDKGCPPALEKLPNGTIIGDQITVTRFGEGSFLIRLWRGAKDVIAFSTNAITLIAGIVTILAFVGIRWTIKRRRQGLEGESIESIKRSVSNAEADDQTDK